VFPNAAGNPLSSSSFLTHHFAKAQKAVKLKCRFHDLIRGSEKLILWLATAESSAETSLAVQATSRGFLKWPIDRGRTT